ncbi:probable FBD-associated F-box protein At1g32375 [Lotus japonicus]|uniref:probable FBD-associated F-box protein At1g32375 n=1 Tax=Lotus japonicus TaxID=34305 RepID=UPI0025851E5D|nr:probable FBD-associated F-box protein At1g32375 [Lotus japonicus]
MRKKNQPKIEDLLSALPDEILRYILSFLPTKFAFTTSVLSKRWNSICYSLTALHFDDKAEEDEETYTRFRRFVDNVLLSPRFQHHPIETLSIVSHSELSRNRCRFNTDEWIEAAKRRSVKNLQLSTVCSQLCLLPGIFTSSQTLVVLKLTGIVMDHGVGSVDLPSLRTLHLNHVLFDQRDDVMKILNGCPIVEDLTVLTPSFECPIVTGGFKTLPNLPKVVKAHINAFDVPFNAIPNVEFLQIEDMERRCPDVYIESYYREKPVFRNLINLKLSFVCFPGWVGVMEVLPYCPKLQTLDIEKLVYWHNYQEKWAHTKELVPECVSLHLTTCSIGNYQIKGMYDDFDFTAYILQNARVLQVLTLHINRHSDESEKDRFFKRLSRCSRISPACKIECIFVP